MKTPSLAQFKRFARDIAPAVRAVLMAQANAELTRERVDAYIRPIFDRYQFRYSSRWEELGAKVGGVIQDPKDLYLTDLDDPLVAAFYADCDAAHKAHGYDLPTGHCPALRAERLLMTAEQCLLELATDLFGVNLADHCFGETRRQALDLLIGASVKTGRVKA